VECPGQQCRSCRIGRLLQSGMPWTTVVHAESADCCRVECPGQQCRSCRIG
jgi:hypothetical protein